MQTYLNSEVFEVYEEVGNALRNDFTFNFEIKDGIKKFVESCEEIMGMELLIKRVDCYKK